MARSALAREILPRTGCYSLIGPKRKIGFGDAAAFWVSFYHLMFRESEAAMKRRELQRRIKELSRTFDEPISYFTSATDDDKGYERIL